MASSTLAPAGAQRSSARVHVQKFGTFLSNMVMPNIGAFIAWGLITALFIEVGWLNRGGGPNAVWGPDSWVAQMGGWGAYKDGGIVAPMITYLLPILIGYTGGKNVYDVRGGVVGAIATMGVIAGTTIPMFMGAMIMGPLGGWTMQRLDSLWDGKIKPGFEMLVNNFSAGIWGGILATLGFFIMSPIVTGVAEALGKAVSFLVDHGLLPLTSLLIEPAKVLFLNNAINHGVLTPLGTQQSLEQGKSVLFLLEANPGPGLGLLLAFVVFGKGMAKASAPGAAIIHFFGGIHEIYFPYVLAKPKLIAATILGGMTGVFVNVLFGVGLVAPAAPGSIIAVYAQTARDSYLGVTLSVLAAAAVSFAVAALLLKTDRAGDAGDLSAATASMESMKGKKSVASATLVGAGSSGVGSLSDATTGDHTGPIRQIVFACDAGMGSSAMGASVLRKKIQGAGYADVSVTNKAISSLSDEWDLVVTHQDLTDRARQRTSSAVHVSVENFMGSPRYDEIVALLGQTNNPAAAPAAPVESAAPGAAPAAPTAAPAAPAVAPAAPAESATTPPAADGGVLSGAGIRLAGHAGDRDGAISEAGDLLIAQGAVDGRYVAAMHEREQSVSTYMGNLLAIPHGTNEAKDAIRRTAMSFIRYDRPLDWNGSPVKFVVGIAGAGDDHLTLLSKLATVFLDEAQVARLEAAATPEEIQDVLAGVEA